MFNLSQTKTVQGFIPFKDVKTIGPQVGQTPSDTLLAFDLYRPVELSELKQDASPMHSERHADLIKLASCVEPTGNPESPIRMDVDNIVDFARQTGPLFGVRDTELVRDWAYAAVSALVAVRIQEFLNGNCSIAKVSAIRQIDKVVITSEADGSSFSMYSIYLGISGGYAACFKSLPIIRRIESNDGFFYAFVSATGDATGSVVEFRVFSFDHELTLEDFETLKLLLALSDDDSRTALQHLKLVPSEQSYYDIAPDASIVPQNRPLDDTDKGALTALVQALVIAHLSGAHVDVFQGSESTGFLSFDSYLSWLWFDFSRKLSTVRIGYCEQCGRAFSLAGHRGMERKYCSEKCKTDAKNEKTRQETLEIRRRFSLGQSINEIVGATERRPDYIRKQLSKWTQLKHELEDDLAENGFNGSDLLKRCGSEGLNLDQLLNSKRKAELKRIANGR